MSSDLSQLRALLGVDCPEDALEQALTHRSFAYENGGLPTNERLEFLGDAVLGLVVTDSLYRQHPDLAEGQLAKMRASIVNSKSLAEVARGLELGEYLRLGRGEEGTGGRDKSSILADATEAIIGSIYLACGLDAANAAIHHLFDPIIDRAAGLGAGLDWKTSLQEFTASNAMGVPDYSVSESGPDHDKWFEAVVSVAGIERGSGEGPSKKAAEQRAAENAWQALSESGAAGAGAS